MSHARSPRLWTAAEVAALSHLPAFAGRFFTMSGTSLVEHGPTGPRPVRFTRAEFYALEAARVFGRQPVQLVRGVVRLGAPIPPPRATGIQKSLHAMMRAFRDGFEVRPQLPLYLGPDNEPHPDVAVVVGTIDGHAAEHPTTAVLVVEVAADSLYEDTTEQAELYASAGIAEYWVVDVTNRRLLVYRDPAPIPDGGAAYRSERVLAAGETVFPLAAPAAAVPVADLLP